MTTTATEDRTSYPSLRPHHDDALQPLDLVPGLWIEYFDATEVGGPNGRSTRDYGRRYVIRPPHWVNGKLVVTLLTSPDYLTDPQIAAGVFERPQTTKTELANLGMVPETNGQWRNAWVIRSADQSSRKTA